MCNAIPSPTNLEQEHRSRLLQALGMAAADKGLAATTMADIVRQAGMSKRTFYEHFTSPTWQQDRVCCAHCLWRCTIWVMKVLRRGAR